MPNNEEKPRWFVGQKVQIVSSRRGYGAGQYREAEVVKVGRTLVHVSTPWGGTEAYRIRGGYANDGYGNSRIVTPEILAEEERREAAMRIIRRVTWEALGVDELEATAALIAKAKQ